jgi:hypothetical protein
MGPTIRDSFLDVKRFLAGILTLLFTTTAEAGVWIQTAANIARTTEGTNGSEVADTRFITSTTAGYAFLQGFVVGGQYLMARSSQSGYRTTAWGPKGGLLLKGFELTAAFLPSARDYPDGIALRTGGGFALNFGYTAKIAGPLRVGLQATYWSMTFSERDGQELAIREKQTHLAPQLAIGLEL